MRQELPHAFDKRFSFKIPSIRRYFHQKEGQKLHGLVELQRETIKLNSFHANFLQTCRKNGVAVEAPEPAQLILEDFYRVKINHEFINILCIKKDCKFRFYFRFKRDAHTGAPATITYMERSEAARMWHSYPVH